MKKFCKQGTILLLALLSLSACGGNNSKYPDGYIGFDKVKAEYSVDKKLDEYDINIKIIASGKKDADREVNLTAKMKPGEKGSFKLLDTKVILPAKKKSATARIRVYPKQMSGTEEVLLICTPTDKESKQSQLTLKLTTK